MADSIVDRVLRFVAERPGSKATDIARVLGLERNDVNSALYGPLRPTLEQDSQYRWYPAGSLRVGDVRTPSTGSLDTPLAQLAIYYLDCIAQEGIGGIGVFASSQWPDYAALTAHPLVAESHDPLADAEAVSILRKARKKNGQQLVHFLGYPVYAKRIRSQRGWEGFILEPVFLHAVTDGAVEEVAPHLNLSALESLTGADRSGLMEEAISLVGELGLDQTYDQLPDLDELMHRLRELRDEWPWVEEPDPCNLASEPPLAQVTTPGIYNRAVVLAVERPPYTRGLETELGSLRTVPEPDYAPTALGQWLSAIRATSTRRRQPLLEPLPLNAEQRQAVEQALENPLTVITGPPGTGKSQVVSSILINAAWRGMTTLFASKNNKAVDVVEVRVNDLGPRPVVLRLGGGEYQGRLSTYLSGLLAATSTEHDRMRYDEFNADHQALIVRAAALDRQLAEVIDLRNRVDDLEAAAEPAREVLGPALFTETPDLDLAQTESALTALIAAVDAADKGRQDLVTRLFWGLVRGKRFARLLAVRAATADAIEHLGVRLPDAITAGVAFEDWRSTIRIASERLPPAQQAASYQQALRRLSGSRSPETIATEGARLVESVAASSERLWNAWLRLQPSRLTPEQRRRLGDYAAALGMIVTADSEGRRAGGEVLRKYHSLFPQIVQSLPCWAITSLSLRNRVPFAPGFFDLLVVDEASQCDIASLLPLLYRAKRVAVIGDPMQLRHVSTLPARQDQQLLSKHGLLDHIGWSYSTRSAFDLAASVCQSSDLVTLRDHHRSHAHIIEFSNKEFYEQRLRVVTRYQQLRRPSEDEPAVRWIDVKGRVTRPSGGGAVNEREAEAVVRELRRLAIEQRYQGSVGAVSPFRAHANRIRDLVSQDAELNRFLAPGSFLADTVHRFQGDERDVMIFSPAVSDGVHRGAITFLRAHPNLFNVAVTRARAALVVVGDLAAARDSGVPYLSRFADYVVGLDRDHTAPPDAVSTDLGPEYPAVSRPGDVSPWEALLYRALYEAGIRPIPQHEVENYRLDLAVFDGQRRLDVEVDGERYHRAWDGEHTRRDQLRSQRLIELGWDVMRFWVYQVRDDLAGCVARVATWLEGLQL